MQWPGKASRENFEIDKFIAAYSRLDGSPQLTVVSKGEKPDYVVKEACTGREFGVELTAVYSDDRSVPDVHMVDPPDGKAVDIPYDRRELQAYEGRLISAIEDKVHKARKGYDKSRPLILSIYLNEYVSIYLGKQELDAMVTRHQALFDQMAPFAEVVFWSQDNLKPYRVRRL